MVREVFLELLEVSRNKETIIALEMTVFRRVRIADESDVAMRACVVGTYVAEKASASL